MPLERMRRLFRRGSKDFRAFMASDAPFGAEELMVASGEVALIANSLSSKGDIGSAIAKVKGGEVWNRTVEESRTYLEVARDEDRWFIDPQAGLYSRKALAIWSEVARVRTDLR